MWYMTCDTWTVIHDMWYINCDTWTVIHELWYMNCDTRTVIHELWYIKCDTWPVIHELWYMNFDTWTEIHEQWYMSVYYYPAKLNIVQTVSFSYDEDSFTRTLVICLSIFSLDFYFCLGRFLLGAYSIICFCLYLPPKKGKLTMTFEIHSPTIPTVNRIISTPGITVDQLLGDIMAYNNEITHNVSILSAPGERYWHLNTQLICFWLCSYVMDIWDNSSEMSKNNTKMF